jgi:hypothetical protein
MAGHQPVKISQYNFLFIQKLYFLMYCHKMTGLNVVTVVTVTYNIWQISYKKYAQTRFSKSDGI